MPMRPRRARPPRAPRRRPRRPARARTGPRPRRPVPLQLRRRRAAVTGADGGPWIVLGLGNPDDEGYGNTRHNAGAMVVARLAQRAGATLRRSRNRAQVAEIRDGDTRVV